MARRVIFLDRDGTVNVDRGYVHRVEDWQFLPGAVEAIRLFRAAGFAVAIVSNQSGIADGKYSLADLDKLHAFFMAELASRGSAIDAFAYCPHSADVTCGCRKPQPGLSKQIEQQLGPIDYFASWTIGDKLSDIQFGDALGTQTVLLQSRYWTSSDLIVELQLVAESLLDAARIVLGRHDFQRLPDANATS
jgi:D-glycero-D-manno-heptose 1,7-bisphosphate phosphatase